MTRAHARTSHPELAKPEFARVYWHHGRYHYRSAKGRPAIILGSDIGSACFLSQAGYRQAGRQGVAGVHPA